MIKLIPFLFIFSVANGAVLPFVLPDQKSLFEHYLVKEIKKADHQITILTSSLDYPQLRKTLIRTASKGINLTLLVQKTDKDSLSLVAYRGVNLYRYQARKLDETIILIDNNLVCHMSGGLEENHLSDDSLNVWCSNDPALVSSTGHHLDRLKKHSKPYLE